MNPETLSDIGTIASVLAILGGLVVWAIRSSIASTTEPLRVVIENNTEALRDIRGTLTDHAERLGDHEVRLVKVETVHEIDEREENLGRARRREPLDD